MAGQTGDERARPPRTWRRRLLVVLSAGFVTLLVCEVGLRLYARSRMQQRGMVFDAELGWRMLPHLRKVGPLWSASEPAWTNSHGWRDAETAAAKLTGARRLVALGDSFVFGVGVDYGERFTEALEELRDGLEVVNLGCNAYGTDQELRVLELEGLGYSPDVVLLTVFLGNDLDDIRYERHGHWPKPYFELRDGELLFVRAEPSWDVWMRSYSYVGEAFFKLLENRVPYQIRAEAWESGDTVGLFVALVERMARVCDGANARLLVLFHYPPDRAASARRPRDVRAIEGVGGLGVEVLDAHAPFRAGEDRGIELFLPDGHWNLAGHRLVAEMVSERLAELGWL